tara:strand:+ start:69 stop:293 length:225 start_codon:yes stop_codon:yes gene_type:complete
MKEHDIITSAARFICNSFKLKSNADLELFESHKEQDIWLGSFAGFMEGVAILIKSKDRELYNELIDSLERVSLR